MTSFKKQQRLELTWFNKDKALIPTENGKYGYSWVSPQDPRYCQTRPLVLGETVEGVQAPKREDAVYSPQADLAPTTDNLLINGESGDVLEALTRVPELADEYLGKVRLCYIDPPFNTEKTFTHYEDNLEHSIWLTMMRDRLLHIKKLLSDDGSIWVHLDDAENHRMRALLDEVFGAGNYVCDFVWKRRNDPRNTAVHTSMDHDYITVYGKSREKLATNQLPRSVAMDAAYTNPDDDPRGPWRRGDLAARNFYSKGLYAITTPSGRVIEGPPSGSYWRVSREELHRLDRDSRVYWGPTGDSRPYIKRFLSEVAGGRVPSSVWHPEEVGFVRNGKEECRALLGEVFDTPKPERLVERIIHIGSNPGDIVLDVFAGSGTTAAVAHKMGRRWVTCELLESNFSTFTLPRLTKVVRGEDPGGITTTAGERVDATDDGLPEGLTPEEAQKLTSLLNKAIKGDDALKKDKAVAKIKAMVKTKNSGDVINWLGGGSFRIAHLAPECFNYDPELSAVTLTSAAFDGENLERSVAAHLSFHLTPEHPVFTGVRGRTRLLVLRAAATPDVVGEIAQYLSDKEKVVIAATAVDPDTAQALRQARKGSRVLHIPNDLFRADEIQD